MDRQSIKPAQAPETGFFTNIPQLAYTLLLAASFPAEYALGSPAGELDPAFGDHGRILLREARFEEMSGVKAFVDPANEKLLIAATGYSNHMLLRFNGDGSPDTAFGDQGAVQLDLYSDSLDLFDAEVLADGKVLVAGAMNVYGDSNNVTYGIGFLARVNPDGKPDMSFGTQGLVTLQSGGAYDSFIDILVQRDDSIVMLGSTNGTQVSATVLARYTKDGQPDTTFGDAATPGLRVISRVTDTERLVAIVQQDDSSFMACGSALPVRQTVVVKFLADGQRDIAFGSNGKVFLGVRQNALEVRGCLTLADAHLVVASTLGAGTQRRAAIFRMTPDGRLDTGFGDGGIVTLPTAGPSTAEAMLLMADGSLAIAGTRSGPLVGGWHSWVDMMVARVDSTTGAIDQEFGNRGANVVDFGTRAYVSSAVPASLLQQADGKLVVVGAQIEPSSWWDIPYIALTRLDPYGAGSNGWAGLNQTSATAPRGGGNVSMHVRRTGGSTGALSIDYRTLDDTAIAGSDYVASSGTLRWPDGDMSEREISLSVSTAHLATDFERFKVELYNSSGGLAVDQATIWINRDPPSAPPPGGAGDNPRGNANTSGGGALGMEFLFLLGLAALSLLRRPIDRGRNRSGTETLIS